VYVLRMQQERMRDSFLPSLREYAARYQISAARLRPGQLLMHPGPVNRGIELSADAIDSEQALIGVDRVGRELDAPVDWPGVHQQLAGAQPRGADLVPRGVLAQRGQGRVAPPLLLHPQHVE